MHVMEHKTTIQNSGLVLLVGTPCNDVVGYQCFRGACCLRLQGEDRGNKNRKNLESRNCLVGLLRYMYLNFNNLSSSR